MDFDLDFPRAHGEPPVRARLKASPEDFSVEEELGFELSGTGEHLYLFIEKRDRNTSFVAQQLAIASGLSPRDVSYAGLKDKRAVTRQWFSLHLPERAVPRLPSWSLVQGDGFTVLKSMRHTQKLRRGDHCQNRFGIVLRDVQGDAAALPGRLQRIAQQGVPNYFGEQRFGNRASNLQQMERFLASHKGKQRGFQDRLRVSAMRSWLFNQVLAERVRQGTWSTPLEGEPEATAALWGRGRSPALGLARDLEQQVLAPYRAWCDFLEHCGLQQERRSLRLQPRDFRWDLQPDGLHLAFALPPGTYATALVRELATLAPEATDAPETTGEHDIVGADHDMAG